MGGVVCCVDFGSTFTKAALVDVDDGRLIGTASTPTTLGSDVLDGLAACRQRLAAYDSRAADCEVLACSSAGGGLRIGVVGNEELVTAEAGRRVALSSGGRVVHVSGGLREGGVAALAGHRPDVVLLVGGTDGGNREVLVGSARALADAGWSGPVVVAGNAEARDEVAKLLADAGTPHVLTDNVVPRIGVLRPEPARAAIREMFLRHVIGGKHLSERADFPAMVRGATPDVVLSAVELLARGVDAVYPGAGDVVVVDVGGATTDVHSVVELDPEEAGLAREVVAAVPVSRTVEADLGLRASATSTAAAGQEAGLVAPAAYQRLVEAARRLEVEPARVPDDDSGREVDLTLASVAVQVAMRRHAGRQQVTFGPDGRVVSRSGKDLREVALLVGSGGVLRHADPQAAAAVLATASGAEMSPEWLLPARPRVVVVDRDYVLAPAGLLAREYPHAAWALLRPLYAGEGAS